MKRKLPKDPQPIIEAWKNGTPISAIARQFEVTPSAICKILTRNGARPTQTRAGLGRRPTYPTEVQDVLRRIEFVQARIGTVRRTTFAGHIVTLPRVAFIDGPETIEATA